MNVILMFAIVASAVAVESASVKRHTNHKESVDTNPASASSVQIYERGVEHTQNVDGAVTSPKVRIVCP
jgi:hypothetical protein